MFPAYFCTNPMANNKLRPIPRLFRAFALSRFRDRSGHSVKLARTRRMILLQ
jgi:hypothetical protein